MVSDKEIYITKKDVVRLRKLIEANSDTAREDIDELTRELDRAHIVESASIPHDVITMNSRILIKDVESGEELIYVLTFPDRADAFQNAISVLTTGGTVMLGCKEGDFFQWGERRFLVMHILYQPERLGNFDL